LSVKRNIRPFDHNYSNIAESGFKTPKINQINHILGKVYTVLLPE
jgi:hypothetical protein